MSFFKPLPELYDAATMDCFADFMLLSNRAGIWLSSRKHWMRADRVQMDFKKPLLLKATVRRKHRMTRARAHGTHTDAEWRALRREFDYRCVKCGWRGRVQKDHIQPVFLGGSDAIENIQPLCKSCNCGKNGDDPNWVEIRRAERLSP